MIDILKGFAEAHPGYEVIYITISGSRLYGTHTEDSDTDYKGIFIPPQRDVLLKKDIDSWTYTSGDDKSKNGVDDIDVQLWSIYKFMNLLKKGETGAIDLLFSMGRQDTIIHNTMRAKELWDKRDKLIHKEVHAFIGYCVGQSKKYNIKGARYAELIRFIEAMKTGRSWHQLTTDDDYEYIKLVMAPGPRGRGSYEDIEYIEVLGKKFEATLDRSYIEDKLLAMETQFGNRSKAATESVDYKALSHAVRVIEEVAELLLTRHITFPLVKRDYIKYVKTGKEDLEVTMSHIANMITLVDDLLRTTDLPEKIDEQTVTNILLGYTL